MTKTFSRNPIYRPIRGISFWARQTATIPATKSEMGPAYMIPSIPRNSGKIRISGSKKVGRNRLYKIQKGKE